MELGWGQLHLNDMTEGGVEGSHPRRVRLLSEDLGMETEQRKAEVHHNLEKLFQIKLPCVFLPISHLAITNEVLWYLRNYLVFQNLNTSYSPLV